MLDDRPYMRQSSFRGRWMLSTWLIVINIGIFALQEINRVYIGVPIAKLALTPDALRHGFVWQFITFQFLHADLWHVLFNALGIFFCGRMVEERLGRSGLLKVYFTTGILGGLLQSVLSLAFPEHFGKLVVGASAGVCGLLATAALLDPGAQFLVWFVLPVRAKYLLIFAIVVSLFYVLVPSPSSSVAHAAHLGGLLGGLAYMRWGTAIEDFFRAHRVRRPRLRPRQLVRARGSGPPPWQRREQEEVPPEEFISREVDPILDKISAHGIQSLTPRERQILEAARAKMERR